MLQSPTALLSVALLIREIKRTQVSFVPILSGRTLKSRSGRGGFPASGQRSYTIWFAWSRFGPGFLVPLKASLAAGDLKK